MRYKSSIAQTLWSRYKKKIIIIGVSLMAFFALVVGGIGYAVYQTAVFAKDTFQSWDAPEIKDDKVVLPNRGWMEGFVISVGSLWLQQNLAETNTEQLKNGLACLDAIGGPSPVDMVNVVKTKIDDERIDRELDTLTQSLQQSGPASQGPAACASWVLSG